MGRFGFWVLVFGLVASCGAANAGSWPQFRGPNGSGRPENDAKLPTDIGPDKHVIWRTALPPGHSSPVIAGNRIFVTAVRDEKLWTIGLDRKSGKVLWEREAAHEELEEIHSIGSHAQSSPATDGELVVSFFGSNGLFCYDRDGKLLWKKQLAPFKNNFGAGSSPIIVDDRVILNQDHDVDSFLVALDKRTGNQIWKTARPDFPRGYATPVIWNNAGRKQIVVPGSLRVIGYDFVTGKEAWSVRGTARITNVTPVVGSDGTLFVTEWAPGGDQAERIEAEPWEVVLQKFDTNATGFIERDELPAGPLKSRFDQIDRDKGGKITKAEYEFMRNIFHSAENVTMAIKPGGKGDITETHVLWKQRRFLPYVPSPLFHEGHLFLVKNGSIMSTVDAKTGRVVKQGRGPKLDNYYSSPVIGDGKIYLIGQTGKLTVVSAEAKWKVLARADFGEPAFATPAIVDGRIYVRTHGSLYCFGLGK